MITMNLRKPEQSVKAVTDIETLRPAIIRTREGNQEVVIRIPAYGANGNSVLLFLEASDGHGMSHNEPSPWVNSNYTFVRYLGPDEVVTITGASY